MHYCDVLSVAMLSIFTKNYVMSIKPCYDIMFPRMGGSVKRKSQYDILRGNLVKGSASEWMIFTASSSKYFCVVFLNSESVLCVLIEVSASSQLPCMNSRRTLNRS